ncbi:MAG: hypothetical protein GY936_13350 [Ignavibacteriae bacterium]|nr:hypothetical protein [Ignavibacteriota bacterium]
MKKINSSFLLLVLLFVFSSLAFSQEKVDVTFEEINGKIYIYYTLNEVSTKQYDINILLKRTSVISFSHSPSDLTGDIGEGDFAGKKNTIIWNVTEEEMNLFDGDDFYFQIIANEIKATKSIPWYYYVGGAVAAGAVAAVTLLGGEEETTTTPTSNFATPPGRP